jgi:tetratricopeptide (TPR) repeat protein
MEQKRSVFLPFVLLLLLVCTGFLGAQERPQIQFPQRYQNGTQLYKLSRFQEAAIEFRRAQETALNANDRSSALYWVILSQLAYSDFGSAIRDMEELEKTAPNSPYARDMLYHRARVYYNQGYFEEALFLLNRYNQSTKDTDRQSADRRAASYFWMGECLFAMGQYEEAEKFYAWVVSRYMESPKVEAASYRIDLIKQKKIESELLALLQWSHEEALRTSEDYQKVIRNYEYMLNMYQRQVAELSSSENIIGIDDQINAQEPGEGGIQLSEKEAAASKDSLTLIERARILGNNVQEILNSNNEAGGR